MPTPTDELSERIVNRLIEEGLIRSTDRDRQLSLLRSGKATPEDWKLSVELAAVKEEQE